MPLCTSCNDGKDLPVGRLRLLLPLEPGRGALRAGFKLPYTQEEEWRPYQDVHQVRRTQARKKGKSTANGGASMDPAAAVHDIGTDVRNLRDVQCDLRHGLPAAWSQR